jgi:hypothetical protein
LLASAGRGLGPGSSGHPGRHHAVHARSGNVRIPCSVGVFAVGVAQAELATDGDTLVWALATVVGQAHEDRRAVHTYVVVLKDDGKIVELDVPTSEHLGVDWSF